MLVEKSDRLYRNLEDWVIVLRHLHLADAVSGPD
jgi:hypothetical protein